MNKRLDTSRIHALCFDVDGTLRDTDDQVVERLAQLLRRLFPFLLKRDPHSVARRIVMAMENPGTFLHGLADRLHIDSYIAKLSDVHSMLRKHKVYSQPPPLIPGVKEMLERLQPHFPIAVVSARGQRSTLDFLDYYEIRSFFKAIATGQTCLHTKPYPDPIFWAAEQMNVLPTECLMIGDSTVDMRAGKAAGAQTIGVLCGFGEEEELIRTGADMILPETPDLVKILLEKRNTSQD